MRVSCVRRGATSLPTELSTRGSSAYFRTPPLGGAQLVTDPQTAKKVGINVRW